MGQSMQKQLDACYFKYPQLIQIIQKKTTLNFDQIKKQCTLIGQGCCAKIYLYKKLNIVLKIMKNTPNPQQILKQIIIMNQVNAIWPNLFQHLVLNQQNTLIGFSMIYFQGKRLWQAYRDPQNIYFSNPQSRIRLVKKVKQAVRGLQSIDIGHGDLHIDNIMIKQLDKTKQECQLMIIDYGLAFKIDDYAPQKPPLTGWAFMKPSQSKTGYFYDASGLNAYMFGRVALQILLLQSYDDYSHFREQSPQRELNLIKQLGFDESVISQIELYFDREIKVRNKMLMSESTMKQCVHKSSTTSQLEPISQKYGWSLLNIIQKNEFDENYFVRHPQKLGYKIDIPSE